MEEDAGAGAEAQRGAQRHDEEEKATDTTMYAKDTWTSNVLF